MNPHRKTKAAIFDRCARALRKAEKDGNELTPVQVESVRRCRKLLLTFIRDLASPKSKYAAIVERALNDVHPRTEYCAAMIIRDVADVCVTLNRVEQGRRRLEEKKHTDVILLVDFLKGDFGPQQ
jgi:hypothetical protein